MAFLVAKQGELIDQIEHNVTQAEAHMEKATKNLQEAIVYQKKSRKVLTALFLVSR